MDEPIATLTVQRSTEAGLARGAVYDVFTTPAVVGRLPGVDVILADPTVSRRHARLALSEDRVEVHNLSSGNGLWLDGREVAPGASDAVEGHEATVQVGGVLLSLLVHAETLRVREPLQAPDARFVVRWDGGACALALDGRWLDLPPSEAKLLGMLLESAGTPVHHWDLQQQLGDHVQPLVSRVRRALRVLLDAGDLQSADVRRWVEATRHTDVDDDPAALVRELVQSRRGHGYVACVPPGLVKVETI